MNTRRQFLKRLAASAVALGLSPYRDVAVVGETYTNSRLGLSFAKASVWEYSSSADFSALRERQVLDDVRLDEAQPLKDPESLLVVLVEDTHHRCGHFAPSISLWDDSHSRPFPEDQAQAHREVMIGRFETAYREVDLLKYPEAVQLRGAGGTISEWSYLHEIDDGASFHLKVCSIVVFKDRRVHTFHLTDSLEQPCVSESTWSAFIQSIDYCAEAAASVRNAT